MPTVRPVDQPADPPVRASDESGQPFELAVRIERHQASLWRYLRLLGADPHEADDLMQDAFVCLAETWRRGEQVVAPFAFLRAVARNLLVGARRRGRRRPLEVSWADAVDEFVAARPELLEDLRLDVLRGCVQRLEGRARQAVEWHHVEGLSHAETASRLGLGLEGVRSLLARSRDALRRCVAASQRLEEAR